MRNPRSNRELWLDSQANRPPTRSKNPRGSLARSVQQHGRKHSRGYYILHARLSLPALVPRARVRRQSACSYWSVTPCGEPARRHSSSYSRSAVLAQEKVDQPSFRSGVELVQLDVTVLDDRRRPVRGLTVDDFTALENGVRRPIRAFTAVDVPARTRAQEPVWAKEAAADVATNQIAEREGRLVIILMDRSIPYMGGTVQAQKIAIAAVDQLGPDDVAAVISTSGAYTPQTFTSDRTRLVRAINQRDWSTESGLFPWSIDGGGDPRCFCGLCVLETLTNVSEAVRNIPRRRKLLLFIGRGIVINLAPLGPKGPPVASMR